MLARQDGGGEAMKAVSKLIVAIAAMLAVQPALAQTPSSTLPAGAQNPALQQPQLVAPPTPVLVQPPRPAAAQQGGPQPQQTAQPQLVPGLQPQQTMTTAPASTGQPGPTPTSPSALIIPGGAGGLCECLINHDPGVPPLDKTRMHQTCLASVDACQSACNSGHFYSFVPHAAWTCPGPPNGQPGGHIALLSRPAPRLLAAR
ncbi:MAG TPA: hypothetical protein VG308_12340 [Stellaceae bacterium]|nr:hypothetical protein [Stellaceae bacterium]